MGRGKTKKALFLLPGSNKRGTRPVERRNHVHVHSGPLQGVNGPVLSRVHTTRQGGGAAPMGNHRHSFRATSLEQWGRNGLERKTLYSTYLSKAIFFYEILKEQGAFKIVTHSLGVKTHKTTKVTARTLLRFV